MKGITFKRVKSGCHVKSGWHETSGVATRSACLKSLCNSAGISKVNYPIFSRIFLPKVDKWLQTLALQTGPPQPTPNPKPYRSTSLISKRTSLGPHHRPVPRVLGGSYAGGAFLMSEAPLQTFSPKPSNLNPQPLPSKMELTKRWSLAHRRGAMMGGTAMA